MEPWINYLIIGIILGVAVNIGDWLAKIIRWRTKTISLERDYRIPWRLLQSKSKMHNLSIDQKKDQRAYYESGQHDFHTLLANQVAIMEQLDRNRDGRALP